MKRLKLGRPSPAMVLATIALVAALAGGAIAKGGKKIGTKQIKNGAVTTAKLTPGERSQALITNQAGAIPGPAATDTTVATLTLPTGSFVVSAQASFGPNAGGVTPTLWSCSLKSNGITLTSADASNPTLAAFGSSVAVHGISTGGTMTLTCNPSAAGQFRNRAIVAERVASVATQ